MDLHWLLVVQVVLVLCVEGGHPSGVQQGRGRRSEVHWYLQQVGYMVAMLQCVREIGALRGILQRQVRKQLPLGLQSGGVLLEEAVALAEDALGVKLTESRLVREL